MKPLVHRAEQQAPHFPAPPSFDGIASPFMSTHTVGPGYVSSSGASTELNFPAPVGAIVIRRFSARANSSCGMNRTKKGLILSVHL